MREIPANSILAVEPSLGHLLVDRTERRPLRIPRPSPERIAGARTSMRRGGHLAHARAAGAARRTQAGSHSALRWLKPRAAHTGRATVELSRAAAAAAAAGIAWLAPRLAAGAAIVAHGTARGAHSIERAAAVAAKKLYASTRRTSVSGKTPS